MSIRSLARSTQALTLSTGQVAPQAVRCLSTSAPRRAGHAGGDHHGDSSADTHESELIILHICSIHFGTCNVFTDFLAMLLKILIAIVPELTIRLFLTNHAELLNLHRPPRIRLPIPPLPIQISCFSLTQSRRRLKRCSIHHPLARSIHTQREDLDGEER